MAQRHTPTDLEPANPELTLTLGDGHQITVFLKGLIPFFSTARTLEAKAIDTLARAKALLPPQDAEADLDLQRFVKATTLDKKEVEAHWSVCQLASQFHRRLVAARKRAVDPLEEAGAIANNLHNRYVDAERRRVAQEQERLRREAEDQARQDRELALQRQREEADRIEAASDNLSEREQRFVDDYVRTQRAVDSARYAGYANPDKAAARLLASEKIATAIANAQKAQAIRLQADAVEAAPLEIQVEEVKPDILRAGGFDRTTWSGEVLDARAFIEAVVSGKHGIPLDVLTVNPVKINEYARSLHERLDLWPGVRARKTTKVV